MAPPSKVNNPELVRQVLVCDALRRRYRRNAAPYRQCRSAEILGVPQSAIAKTLKGYFTSQIQVEDRQGVFDRDARKQYWDAKAREYRPRVVCQRLGICLRTYYHIVANYRGSHNRTHEVTHGPIHTFLTGRRAA